MIGWAGVLMSYRTMGSIARGKTDFIAYKQSSLLMEAALSAFSLMKDLKYISTSKRKWIARIIAYERLTPKVIKEIFSRPWNAFKVKFQHVYRDPALVISGAIELILNRR
jgi:hypothetical protein